MKAKEFDEIWHKTATKELLQSGFIRNGSCYLKTNGTAILQFSKTSQKTIFTGFQFSYTHTFLETWTDEYPKKWPLLREQFLLTFSKLNLIKCAKKGLLDEAVLVLDYSNGKRNINSDFPMIALTEMTNSEINNYIGENVMAAKLEGIKILNELTIDTAIKLLSGKVDDSFMPKRWLKTLEDALDNQNFTSLS